MFVSISVTSSSRVWPCYHTLIMLIPYQGKMRAPLTFLDLYSFCLLNALHYKTYISICKPNHRDLMSCGLESNWASFTLLPLCFQFIYDDLKILNVSNKPLAELKVFFFLFLFSLFFYLSYFNTSFDCDHWAPIPPSSASLVTAAPWFETLRCGE